MGLAFESSSPRTDNPAGDVPHFRASSLARRGTTNTGASLAGRALAQGGAVTMATNSVTNPGDMGTPALGATWGMIKSRYR